MALPSFDSLAASAASSIFAAIGTSATYITPAGIPYSIEVIDNPEVGEFADFEDSSERRTYMALLCEHVEAVPGGNVAIGLDTFTLVKKVFGDGAETRWAVRNYAG